jgi:hypothetical protein
MALKQFYATEAEVPTELKDHYVLKDGKYELSVEGYDSVVGVTAKNTELINKQKTDKVEIDRLTNDLAASKIEIGKLSGDIAKAGANALPTGYVAVAKKDAEALEEFKKRNLKPEEVFTKLEEIDGLNNKVKEFELDTAIKSFADAEKIENVDALTRLIKQDGVTPLVKEVEENGKKVKRGYLAVTNGDKQEEKSYKDFKDAQWKPFASALDLTTEKPKSPGQGPGPKPAGAPTDDEVAKAAQAGQARATRSAF